MRLTALDFTAIAAYLLGFVGFGVLVRRIRTFSDYAVGERAVPGPMVFASLAATYIGPGYTVGLCSKGFSSGWLFFFVTLAFTAQVLLCALVFAPRLHRFGDCYTLGEVMAKIYGRGTHLATGIISTTLCIGFVAIMAKVGGIVLHGTTGIPMSVGVVVVTFVGALYTFTGGIKSVIATDSLQFVIFAVVVPVFLYAVISGSGVGLAAVEAQGWQAMASSSRSMGPVAILGLVTSFLFGETLIPPYANRALAARSEMVARKGFLAAAGYSLMWSSMVVSLGVVGRLVVPTAAPDDVFLTLATRYLPHGFIGMIVVAIAAIIMSSQESVLNAGAVSFTRDVWPLLGGRAEGDRGALRLSRVATLVIAAFAAVAAIYAPSIIDGLLIIYALWAPTVLPPLLLGLVLPRAPRGAALPAMIAGGVTSVVWQHLLHEPGHTPAILVGLAANLVVYGTVALARREQV